MHAVAAFKLHENIVPAAARPEILAGRYDFRLDARTLGSAAWGDII
jgi:hypothetical protein